MELVFRSRRCGTVVTRKLYGRELYIVVEKQTSGLIESYGMRCRWGCEALFILLLVLTRSHQPQTQGKGKTC